MHPRVPCRDEEHVHLWAPTVRLGEARVLKMPPITDELVTEAAMLLRGPVGLQEVVPNLVAVSQRKVGVGCNSQETPSFPWNRDPKPGPLTLVPCDELRVRRIAKFELEGTTEVRDHQMMFEEPLLPPGIVFPPDHGDRPTWGGPTNACVALFECASALQLPRSE